MAQTHQLLNFEPWLKPPKKWVFEPWLKGQKFRCLSHGSKSKNIGVWAMAQTPKKWTFEPWLKPTFDMQIFTWCFPPPLQNKKSCKRDNGYTITRADNKWRTKMTPCWSLQKMMQMTGLWLTHGNDMKISWDFITEKYFVAIYINIALISQSVTQRFRLSVRNTTNRYSQ